MSKYLFNSPPASFKERRDEDVVSLLHNSETYQYYIISNNNILLNILDKGKVSHSKDTHFRLGWLMCLISLICLNTGNWTICVLETIQNHKCSTIWTFYVQDLDTLK